MKPQKARSLLPLCMLLGACCMCLITGYYAGYLYGNHRRSSRPHVVVSDEPEIQPASTVASAPASTSIGTSKSTNKYATSSSTSSSGLPYYTPGTTKFDASQKTTQREPICLNTCKAAKNGVCNDGRMKKGHEPSLWITVEGDLHSSNHKISISKVECDLGTDCADCGPWTPSGHTPWVADNVKGPVARLVDKNIQIRVKQTATTPPFYFAYTDPSKDYDVSGHMNNNGIVESGISKLFYKIFKSGCKPEGSIKPGLFVDVGSNFGWFAVMAAMMGCRVVAFEPVPHFHAFLEYSVHLNGLAGLVDMRGNAVSHMTQQNIKMVVPSKGIWGTAGIDGLNIDRAIEGSVNEEILVPTQSLDELVQEDVLLMKVDVEGWEWSVMQGAAQLFKKYAVHNLAMEYSPGVPERYLRGKELVATVQMLVNMVDAGYSIAHLGDMDKHMHDSFDSPLPKYEEVTAHNLMYDLVDAHLFSQSQMGCPPTPELQKFRFWAGCQAAPEDVSPRSLRGTLGHNTNIWAAKPGQGLMNLDGHVGIFNLDTPFKQFYATIENPDGGMFGMGSRLCGHLPADVQVHHRCPCTNKAVCGEEAAAVEQVVASKGLPSNYVLSPDGKLVEGMGKVADLFKKIKSARDLGKPYLPGAVKGMLTR